MVCVFCLEMKSITSIELRNLFELKMERKYRRRTHFKYTDRSKSVCLRQGDDFFVCSSSGDNDIGKSVQRGDSLVKIFSTNNKAVHCL